MYGIYVPSSNKKTDAYWFVNEHEIRISTGIAFVLGLFSLFLVLLKAEYTIPLIIISFIWLDFVLKVFLDPKYSIFGSIVRPFLKGKAPLYVGAIQKRFAWEIGFVISTLVLLCLVVQSGILIDMGFPNAFAEIREHTVSRQNMQALFVTPLSPPILLCIICLVFMWSESVIGYCVGCNIYSFLVKKNWIKQQKAQNCLDGSCDF